MKQLTCEMCGSTDLLKQEGVFVCQTCGTKYSVEEAKKMMIEGTVEVTGTVTVDKSIEAENMLIVARRSMKEKNYSSAAENFEKVLQIDPNNWEANFYRSYCKTMTCSVEDDIASFELTREAAVSTLKMVSVDKDGNYKSEGYNSKARHDIVNAINSLAISLISKRSRPYNTIKRPALEVRKIVFATSRVYNYCIEALKNIDISLLWSIKFNVEHWEYYISEVKPSNRDETYRINSAMSVRDDTIALIKKAYTRMYWNEHAEEKQQLDSEKNSLSEQIKQLTEQITPSEKEISDLRNKRGQDVPSKAEKENVLNELSKLRSELSTLGIFKGKEKKALQERISELSARVNPLTIVIEQEEKENIRICNDKIREIEERIKPTKDEITTLQNRLTEIENTLTKEWTPTEKTRENDEGEKETYIEWN